ncbi:hypothetical protein JCM11491_004627 [Sporobolomyces phaffii]
MERLSHLFESSAKIVGLPKEFKAAQFTSAGSRLAINTVQWLEPKEGEIVVKVSACSIHSTDEIAKHGLLSHLKYPITPGSGVTGEVVQVGPGTKHWKVGQHVVGVAAHGCLAEYAVLNADYVAELKKKEAGDQELHVEVFEAARVEAELLRFEREEKDLSKDDARRTKDANERLHYMGDGVDVVIGDGGPARIALAVIKSSTARKDRRVLLLTANDEWNHSFYGIEEGFHLKLNHHDLGSTLKAIGGIHFAIATAQPPQESVGPILEAMRYGSELVMLSPDCGHKLELPLAPVVGKALSIRGPTWPSHAAIDKVLALVHSGSLYVPVQRYRFDDASIERAWTDLEDAKKCDQPVVVVCETLAQAKEAH